MANIYNQIRNVPLGTGRWFNEEDNNERRRVAVVGWELLKNVFPGRPAVGSSMLLNGVNFDVIGVLAKVGQDGNNGTNGRIFIPIETMRNLFPLRLRTGTRWSRYTNRLRANQVRGLVRARKAAPPCRAEFLPKAPWPRPRAGWSNNFVHAETATAHKPRGAPWA